MGDINTQLNYLTHTQHHAILVTLMYCSTTTTMFMNNHHGLLYISSLWKYLYTYHLWTTFYQNIYANLWKVPTLFFFHSFFDRKKRVLVPQLLFYSGISHMCQLRIGNRCVICYYKSLMKRKWKLNGYIKFIDYSFYCQLILKFNLMTPSYTIIAHKIQIGIRSNTFIMKSQLWSDIMRIKFYDFNIYFQNLNRLDLSIVEYKLI